MVFKDGDVPAGTCINLQRGGVAIAAQFDSRSHWPDGSLRVCTACFRDSDFKAGENRTYSVIVGPGAFENASVITLAEMIGVTDLKVEFTGINGSTTGAIADLVGSLNTHAIVPTRVTQYEKGNICDSWMIWGMSRNQSGEHPHLKVIWYVSRWKKSDNSLVAYEVCAVCSQDWWSVDSKEKLAYTAILKNSTKTIQVYRDVVHPYMSQWATVRMDDDDQHATRHWIGADRPKLLYKPDRAYWISTDMVPALDLTTQYVMPSSYSTGTFGVRNPRTYQPCSPQAHRGAIDAGGGYPGRGILTNMDCIAFATQTSPDTRIMRVNAFAGLHVPYHRRSNKIRTRPGDGAADMANTLCSLTLWDERGAATPHSFYDFAADGMPTPAHAYVDTRTDVQFRDHYVDPSGGTSLWRISDDSTHAVNYSYFSYLLEGERYFLEATLDLGINAIQNRIGSTAGGMAPLQWYDPFQRIALYPGTPSTPWAGIALRALINQRHIGWAANQLSAMVIVPNDDVHANYVKQLLAVNAKWLKMSAQFIPPEVRGTWGVKAHYLEAPWMTALIGIGIYAAYERTHNPDWLPMAEFIARGPIHHATIDRVGVSRAYGAVTRSSHMRSWDPETNPCFPDWYVEFEGAAVIGATGIITCDPSKNGWGGPIPYKAGDSVVLSDLRYLTNPTPTVPELGLGSTFYMVNPSGTTFQLSPMVGGQPITFSQNYEGVTLGVILQAMRMPEKAFNADSFGSMQRMLIIQAARHRHPEITTDILNKYLTYYSQAGIKAENWATWNVSPTAAN
jgi:hypothetical protein